VASVFVDGGDGSSCGRCGRECACYRPTAPGATTAAWNTAARPQLLLLLLLLRGWRWRAPSSRRRRRLLRLLDSTGVVVGYVAAALSSILIIRSVANRLLASVIDRHHVSTWHPYVTLIAEFVRCFLTMISASYSLHDTQSYVLLPHTIRHYGMQS